MSAVASTGAMTLTIYDSTTESILISGSPVMNEGGSATYTVKLTSAPTASVIMSISISGDMTLSSSSITITTSN